MNVETWLKQKWVWGVSVLLVVLIVGVSMRGSWGTVWTKLTNSSESGEDGEKKKDDHHDEPDIVHISDAACISLGLKNSDGKNSKEGIGEATIRPFYQSIEIPGVIKHRKGLARMYVPAPMGGVVTKVFVTRGEIVSGTMPLFEIRLTHEELAQSQGDYLKMLAEMKVVVKEIKRLEALAGDIVPRKTLLDRQYEKEKLDAGLVAMRERLRLHGLTFEHIKKIETDGKLFETLTVYAGRTNVDLGANVKSTIRDRILQVDELLVEPGILVVVGGPLCSLVDNRQLYIEGHAFEKNIPLLKQAMGLQEKPKEKDENEFSHEITVVFESHIGRETEKKGLKILFLDNHLDIKTGVLNFYVSLVNSKKGIPEPTLYGDHYADWVYRAGQRVTLNVPYKPWTDHIVLPADAVVRDGVEWYVFKVKGKDFVRVPVVVKYTDRKHVVIEQTGTLYEGDTVAMKAARQLLLHLKNKSGGGAVGHGHSH